MFDESFNWANTRNWRVRRPSVHTARTPGVLVPLFKPRSPARRLSKSEAREMAAAALLRSPHIAITKCPPAKR
jgi:hypothetical protein